MSNASDFIIEDGVLQKYVGPGGIVKVPEGITAIDMGAFYYCQNVTDVIIPDSVTSVGAAVFEGCSNLKSITLPHGLKNVSGSILGNYKVYGLEENPNYQVKDGIVLNKKGNTITGCLRYDPSVVLRINEGPAIVDQHAFFYTELEELWLPDTITTIRGCAFFAPQIKVIHLPKSVTKVAKDFVQPDYWSETTPEDYAVYVSFYLPELAEKRWGSIYSAIPIYLGGSIEDLPTKVRKDALKGFLYAISHGIDEINAWRSSYVEYLGRNKKTYLKKCADNPILLRLMLEESLITKKEAEKILETVGPEYVEERALLMAFAHGSMGSGDMLSLDENDPEFQRDLKMAKRREAIKNQKGIRGITFVATGHLNHFGSYDEYTGEKDLSDLKNYIEKRGGFLRSAVSSKTDYLICNDATSASAKMLEAKLLGVTIISEAEFLKLFEE